MEESWSKQIQALSIFQWVLSFLILGPICTLILLYLMFTSLWSIPVVYLTWLFSDWDTPERAPRHFLFIDVTVLHLSINRFTLFSIQGWKHWSFFLHGFQNSSSMHFISLRPSQWKCLSLVSSGGRRTEWVRRWSVWVGFRDYFPIKLVQSSSLSPDRNYVLGCHPHGIMATAAFCNFATEANGFSNLYPGVRPWLAVLAGIFRFPIFRDYLMSAGLVPVNKDSIRFLLSQCGPGNAVFIVVGGAAESLQSRPGEHVVMLTGRKGFVRMALQQGADLVPVYTFGENEIYEQVRLSPDSWGWKLQLLCQKFVGFAPCLFYGRGVFNVESWGLNPIPRPLTTVVGHPIRVAYSPVPSEEEVSHYHELYTEGLKHLFDEYKVSCGLSKDDTLRII